MPGKIILLKKETGKFSPPLIAGSTLKQRINGRCTTARQLVSLKNAYDALCNVHQTSAIGLNRNNNAITLASAKKKRQVGSPLPAILVKYEHIGWG